MIFKAASRNLLRSKVRSLLTFAAMSLATGLLTLTLCLNDGILLNMLEAATDTWQGHLVIRPVEEKENRDLHHTFKANKPPSPIRESSLSEPAPRLDSFVLISSDRGKEVEAARPARLVGVRPKAETKASQIHSCLTEGAFLTPSQSAGIRGEALIGETLAKRLQVQIGDTVALMGQAARGSFASGLLTVRGLLQTGDQQVDSVLVVTHLKTAQTILNLKDQAHYFILSQLQGPLGIQPVQTRLSQSLNQHWVQSWRDLKPQIAATVDFWAVGQGIVTLIFYSAVALICLNTMSMAVLERKRECAILRAIGLPRRNVVLVFLAEGFLLGLGSALVGGLLGGLVALCFAIYPMDLTPVFGHLELGNMSFKPTIRAWIRESNILLPGLLMVLLGTLSALWPTGRILRPGVAQVLGERF